MRALLEDEEYMAAFRARADAVFTVSVHLEAPYGDSALCRVSSGSAPVTTRKVEEVTCRRCTARLLRGVTIRLVADANSGKLLVREVGT